MPDFLVLGAGMVGISTALELQSRGHNVAVLDRTSPGLETSYGNAGIIQAEAAGPPSMPRALNDLFRMGLGISNEVTWTTRELIKSIPALFQYYRASEAARYDTVSSVYSQLTSRSSKDHSVWINASNAKELIARDGYTVVFKNRRDFDVAAAMAERLHETFGVASQTLEGAEFVASEPAAISEPAGALVWSDPWSCRNPSLLTSKYGELFVRNGGQILEGDASTLRKSGAQWKVATTQGYLSGEQVIVALGPWAPQFLRPFGYTFPMINKRGYHAHFKTPIKLRRPVLDHSNGVVAASMDQGLRVTSGVAIADLNEPSKPHQLHRGAKGLAELFALGDQIGDEWLGTRPFIADMLPVVGHAPNHHGMWFNFGHGHQGFTLGPTTAKILADAVNDRKKTQAIQDSLSPTRFA